jgi:hypothetical protein
MWKGKELKKEIIDFVYATDGIVQVACSYTNTGINSVYLTTSGKVCTEDFGYVEDTAWDDDEVDVNGELVRRLDLPSITWSSICRLQRWLEHTCQNK